MDEKKTQDKNKKNWKEGILSSGIPLEMDVGKLLLRNKFKITPDYGYVRMDRKEGIMKEYSIDWLGSIFLPSKSEEKGQLNLLLECKYCQPGIKWIFLPYPDKSLHWNSNVIKYIDFITYKQLKKKIFWNNKETSNIYYKSIVLDKDNKFLEKDTIKEGITQLVYSIPRFLEQSIEFYMKIFNMQKKPLPVFFSNILVTTSNLYTIDNDYNYSDYYQLEINNSVIERKFVIYKNPKYPMFYNHCQYYLLNLRNLIHLEDNSNYKEHLFNSYLIPFDKIIDIIISGGWYLPDYFDSVIICNYKYLDELIKYMKKIANNNYKLLINSKWTPIEMDETMVIKSDDILSIP